MKKLKEALLDFNQKIEERNSAAKFYTKVLEEWEKEHIELGSSIVLDLSSTGVYFLFQTGSNIHQFVYLDEYRGWDNNPSIPVKIEGISGDGWVDLRIGTKRSYFTRVVSASVFMKMLEHMIVDEPWSLKEDGTVY